MMHFVQRVAAIAVGGAFLTGLSSGSASAATVALAGPASATPGGTVTVAVTLSPDLSGIRALQGALSYDPAVLAPLPSQDATAPQGFHAGEKSPFPGETIPRDADLFRMNASPAGRVVFGYVKNPANVSGSAPADVPATALRITFSVAPGASGSTALTLSPYTVNGRDMPAVLLGGTDGVLVEAAVGGPLSITLGLAGDADGDGAVTVRDVLCMLETASGTPAGSVATRAADVWPAGAPDGAVTLEDAIRTWRFLNGLESGLG